MPGWIIDIVKFVIGGLAGGWLTFIRMKWKLKQDRKTDWAERRMSIYDEGLRFIFEVEQNQMNPEELHRIRTGWIDWFLSKGNGFPPFVFDAVLGAINWTAGVMIDIPNENVDRETKNTFRQRLQTAKQYLLDKKDIGWLPEDLR